MKLISTLALAPVMGTLFQRLELKKENIVSDDEIGFIFSLDICVCVGVVVNGVVSWTKCPESLL